jgi:hypothetical protein
MKGAKMRDDFSEEVKRTVASRVGNRCSNPSCRTLTSGPQIDPTKSLNVGVAAHITAASPKGPRYNPSLSSEQRRHANNAIWLCQNHGKLVDNDESRFTEAELRRWKAGAEAEAYMNLGKTASSNSSHPGMSEEELTLLTHVGEDGEIFVEYTDQTGRWVQAGSHDFMDESDPAVAASYLDALDALLKRRLARREDGDSFKLTGEGFRTARALKQRG